MRIEIVAVGTELLLGQITDTNSQWMGEHLAAVGVTSHFHQAVGDNHERMVLAFRTALARSDGVIVCGGLGPDPRRHHPRGHRRGDERPPAPGRGRGGGDPGHVLEPGPGDARLQPPAGRRARGRHHHPPDQGHRSRAHLPGGPQGHLRGARRPLRDGRHVRTGHRPRSAAADDRTRRDHRRHRQPGDADLGDERVRSGRGAGRPHRPAGRPRRVGVAGRGGARNGRHHRLSGQRDRGDQGAGHGAGRGRTRRRPGCSMPRRPRSGGSSDWRPGTWCSAWTTRPSRMPWPGRSSAPG